MVFYYLVFNFFTQKQFLSNKINRGTFSAVFMLQVLKAIDYDEIKIKIKIKV